jgi:predicted ATPase
MKLHNTEVIIARPQFLGGGTWTIRRLRPMTVLFGKNGSGKSLLLRSWRSRGAEEHHYVVPERTGDFGFNINYLPGELNATERLNQSQRNFAPEYRQRTFARVQAYYNARGATRSGQLTGPPPDELEALIAILFPDFRVELNDQFPPYKIIRAAGEAEINSAEQLSSGEAQFLGLGVDIVTMGALWELRGTTKRTLLVDEPDAHIHPDLQVRFADFLLHVARRFEMQVAVATHSTTLLSALGQFAKDDAGVVYMERGKAELEAQPFSDVLKEISAILGGHALMGPLFDVPLLLVEGDDDYRVWSQVPRHHITSFAVIPCEGELIQKYQRSLEKVFSSLREAAVEPAGYALLDGDKPLPAPGSPPQDHVQFIQLACHETENLYLTDEVLGLFGKTWEEAREEIKLAAAQFGAKESALVAAANADRRHGDVKEVITEIAKILDPKHLRWTTRVGVGLGRAKPTGSLAEFLGEPVVSALW